MKTELQRAITKEHLIEICRKMHFTLTDEQLSKLQYSFKYTWIVVEFRVKGYGYISFGIDNHHQHRLSGGSVTKELIQDALNKGTIDLKIWRFVNDEIYKREVQATELLKEKYSQPTADEFYQHYYAD